MSGSLSLGWMGHIDAGKTSVVRTVATRLSTAADDKSRQSRERGITLDLGFSLLQLPSSGARVTLVDCPGHASLVRTVLGGASIIDALVLVVAAPSGVEPQGAEAVVIGELVCDRMLVVMNKVDLLGDGDKELRRAESRVRRALRGTKFAKAPIIPYSAARAKDDEGMRERLLAAIERLLVADGAKTAGEAVEDFVLAGDHCFAVRGVGTVVTGTVLSGRVAVGDEVVVPGVAGTRKVRSIESFGEAVAAAGKGERVGVALANFDAALLERGLVASPGALSRYSGVIIPVRRVRFFRGDVESRRSFHVTVGHATVMARVLFFRHCGDGAGDLFVDDHEAATALPGPEAPAAEAARYVAVLHFDHAVVCPPESLVIASRLDMDPAQTRACRFAFHGRMGADSFDPGDAAAMARLRVVKRRVREGDIDRVVDEASVIVRGIPPVFIGLHSSAGRIEATFGGAKAGKLRVVRDVRADSAPRSAGDAVRVAFKSYVFADKTKLLQDSL